MQIANSSIRCAIRMPNGQACGGQHPAHKLSIASSRTSQAQRPKPRQARPAPETAGARSAGTRFRRQRSRSMRASRCNSKALHRTRPAADRLLRRLTLHRQHRTYQMQKDPLARLAYASSWHALMMTTMQSRRPSSTSTCTVSRFLASSNAQQSGNPPGRRRSPQATAVSLLGPCGLPWVGDLRSIEDDI